jgi:5-methylcytosine-specific restriction endonuclease McrA
MDHLYHDRERKKRKVLVACSECPDHYKIRYDRSLPKYREYKNLSPFKCPACVSKELVARNKLQIGSKNPRWKGGKTSEIQKFYCSPEWKALRTKVFIRDNYTCKDCLKRGGKLEANHIKARWKYPELRLDINNIETLCKPCHYKKKWMAYV